MVYLDDIIRKLNNHPEIKVSTENDGLLIAFTHKKGQLKTVYDGREFTVFGPGGHCHLDDVDEVVEYVLDCAISEYRTIVLKKKDFEYKWHDQKLIDGKWVTVHSCGRLFYPFWRQTTIEYRK